jgi:hypothetical protein
MGLPSPASIRLVLLAAMAGGCGDEGRFGPPESYVLLAPDDGSGVNPPLVHRLADADAPVVVKLFFEGFAAEMLRTVYMARQLVRQGGALFPGGSGAAAVEGLPVVIGLDRDPYGRGLALHRALRSPLPRPDAVWLGLGRDLEADRALVQTVSGRLADYVLDLVMSGGTFADSAAPPPAPLRQGYRMAMEVIAREWRVGRGPMGVVGPDAGTATQRAVFADVRENRFVLTDDRRVRVAAELLASPGVAATVIYRIAQAKTVGQRVARDDFYAPFSARVPPGVSAAAVLGPLRNFQAKLLAPWAAAARGGHSPRDIAELIDLYVTAFPDEKRETLRIYLATTFGGTVVAGGVPPSDPTRALAELDRLLADLLAGRRSLRAAL